MGSEKLIATMAPSDTLHAAGAPAPEACVRSADPRLSKYFGETAPYWDQLYTGHKFVNWHMAERRQLVVDAVRRISQGRALNVLDLGSGTGVLTRDLLRMGHTVVALDCSETMLRTLTRSLPDHPGSRFLGAALGSAGEVCFRAGVFDLILCIGVIQYQPHPENVFEEIARLLKPGGSCVFTLPNQLSLHHLLDPWCSLRYLYRLMVRRASFRVVMERPAVGNDVYERRYFGREIPALVSREALSIRETIPFGYGPLTLANKPVLPNRLSIALSKVVTKLSQFRPRSCISHLANRWVIILDKPHHLRVT